MTGTHEQAGLGEPADGTAEMRAVDSEYLKGLAVHVSHPTGNIGGLAVPGTHKGVAERG